MNRLVRAVLAGDRKSEDLLGLLMEIHGRMLTTPARATIVNGLGDLARDSREIPVVRCLALILLGGFKCEATDRLWRGLLGEKDENVFLFILYSHAMNPVVDQDTSSNGKSYEGFWRAVLHCLGSRCNSALGIAGHMGDLVLFSNCLGTIEGEGFRDRAERMVRGAQDPEISDTVLCLLLKDEAYKRRSAFLQELVLDPTAPDSLRNTAILALPQGEPASRRILETLFKSDPNLHIRGQAFFSLVGEGPEALVEMGRSGELTSYLEMVRSDSTRWTTLDRVYYEISLLRDYRAPDLAISLLSKEGDAAIRKRTAEQLGGPRIPEHEIAASVRVLTYLARDPDRPVADAAVLAMAPYAMRDSYPGSLVERVGWLDAAAEILRTRLPAEQESEKLRTLLDEVTAVRARLAGR
ncbi:MAG: hypothetical protein HYY17_03720 [Planctomycetes bacterium]|nr:hypothetical protein [Planctomycetota bacterium]